MNFDFDMLSDKQEDAMDPNYIYPMPYIDPMMYMNGYGMNSTNHQSCQTNPNTSGGYMTYMNPFVNYPVMGQQQTYECDDEYEYVYVDENMCMPNTMPPGMMMPGMMPNMMPPGMMMPGMMPNMMPPGMMMPGMMSNMMPGIPQIHMEEFDEEEM